MVAVRWSLSDGCLFLETEANTPSLPECFLNTSVFPWLDVIVSLSGVNQSESFLFRFYSISFDCIQIYYIFRWNQGPSPGRNWTRQVSLGHQVRCFVIFDWQRTGYTLSLEEFKCLRTFSSGIEHVFIITITSCCIMFVCGHTNCITCCCIMFVQGAYFIG